MSTLRVNPNMGQVKVFERSDMSFCLALFCAEQAPESLSSEEPETAPSADQGRGSHERKTFMGTMSVQLFRVVFSEHFVRRKHSNSILGTIAPLQVVSALHHMTDSVELCSELERCRCSNLTPELRYVHACYMDPESSSCHEAYLDLSAEQLWNVERFVMWEGTARRQSILRAWLREVPAREPTPTRDAKFTLRRNVFWSPCAGLPVSSNVFGR